MSVEMKYLESHFKWLQNDLQPALDLFEGELQNQSANDICDLVELCKEEEVDNTPL